MKQKQLRQHQEIRRSSSLLLKMFALVVMMLCCVGSVWAVEYTPTVTLKGNETFDATGLCSATFNLNGATSTSESMTGSDGNTYYKLAGNSTYINMKFVYGGTTFRFMPGDKVSATITSTANNKNVSFSLKDQNNVGDWKTVSTAGDVVTVSHTLKADEIQADGSINVYRANGGYDMYYREFKVTCQRHGNDIFVSTNDASKGSASMQVTYGTANVALNTDVIAASVANGANVKFTANPAAGKLFWYWKKNGVVSYDSTNPLSVYTINEGLDYQAVFTDGVKHYVYTNDANIGEVHIERDGNASGKDIHVNPGTPNITFVATEKVANSFKGWFTNVERTTPASNGADGTKYTDKTYKLTDDQLNNGVTLYAKFEALALTVTANWTPTIPANAAGWGLATVTVKANGADVDASKYTLKYEVVSGHLSLADGTNNATVTGGFNDEETAQVKVTATPVAGTGYVAGSTTFNVKILPVAKPNITVTPSSKTVRIGEAVTLGVTRETGFYNPHYEWTLSDNAKTCLYGYTDPISETQAANTDNPSHKFVAKAATTEPIAVNLKFYSGNGYYNNTSGRLYEEANLAGGITVKPVAVPTVYQDIDGVHFTYEQDYGDVDAYIQYFVGTKDNDHRTQVGFGESNGKLTVTNLPADTRIFVESVIRFKYPSDASEYTYVTSAEVQFVTDPEAEFPTLALMMQPRYKDGIAKRYIPFGVMNKRTGDDDHPVLTPQESQWPNDVTYGKGAITNNTMGYILGGNSFPVEMGDIENGTDGRGICISRNGKTHWGWTSSDEATRQWLPMSSAFCMDVAGTMDVVLFAENTFNEYANSGKMSDRRYIKAWYLNDQCTDGKPIELESWGILGKRYEGNFANGGNGNELRLHIRLPQLGKNGKATLFFTYEGDNVGNDVNDTDHDLWIRGFMIQRPDLRISIGRTDNKYASSDNNLIKMCVKEENTPYIWSFEPQSTTKKSNNTTNIHKDGKDAVGFRPASDTDEKKSNVYDGRTYICGEQCDHLLVYCDNEDEPGNVSADERPEFDGRSSRDTNAHLELVRPTVMAGNNGNDDQFNPIKSNGIKVNVTGSGWFKVWASAPNGPVKMKVLTSTNGGVSKIRVLREFDVPQTEETEWKEYTAYLKAQLSSKETYDELYAPGDPEAQYMSLYVVFEAADGSVNADGKYSNDSYPQLNIHQLSWLNEEPVIYNFQREENPVLLTTMQKSSNSETPDFYWQMGTNLKENGVDTYDRMLQTTKANGQESTYDKTSTSNGNGGKSKGYVWDIAAPARTNAHTEAAYAEGHHDFDTDHEFKSDDTNTNKLLEFGSPISGSFLRICSMKNNYIVAHFVQSREAKDGDGNVTTTPTVYVLDELGKLVPYCSGADTFTPENLNKFTPEARMHGCVSYTEGLTQNNRVYTVDNGEAFRIDIIAPAGKEFFICANNGALSLARLESISWRVNNTPVPGINGSLTLTDNASNSSNIATAMSGDGRYAASVTLNRSFTVGKWASLVLPFSMNEVKFKQVFGDDAKCIHFTDAYKSSSTVKLTHHFYDMIVAGRPVFVRPSKAVDPVITDVTLQAAEVINTTPFSSDFVFTASYDGTTINPNDLYLSNNNAILYYTGTATTYPGMRSFIKTTGSGYDFTKPGAGTSQVKAMFVNFDDEEEFTTGIDELISGEFGEDVIVVAKSTKVYDLNGRIVAVGEDINSLPAGVYIVNGKKYIVK